MQPSRIPATIISGFLGSGKTTLLRSIMKKNANKRIAIIVNEFGSLGIDGEILKKCAVPGCEEENIVELANGCICCTVADEFLPTMESLLNRPSPPQHIIIETSGLALPKPLIKAFNWPDIKTKMTVDGVVTVVDSPAVIAGRFADDPEKIAQQRQADPSLDHDNPLQEVFEDQLNSADLVLLNKVDLITSEQLEYLTDEIKKQIPKAVKILPLSHGKIEPEVILGIHAGAENDLQTRPSHHDGVDEDHEHDDFTSFVVNIPPVSSPKALENKLLQLTNLHDILRIKGYIQVIDKPMRLEIHGVGERFSYHFDRPWYQDEQPQGRLIIIGQKSINQKAIQAALETQI
ncbi:MAG: cobalamin biosynthesis protein CobW [Commensalibacter sp.]|nr:cobalamin biosynthesis protein CobW [Commensalibacter sp.]